VLDHDGQAAATVGRIEGVLKPRRLRWWVVLAGRGDLDDLLEQSGLGVEDAVDGLDRDAGLGGDGVHRGQCVPTIGEQAVSGVDDPPSGRCRPLATSIWLGLDGWHVANRNSITVH
jgi:hypothetical protein